MSLDVTSIVALTLCLCACTGAVPEEDFLDKGTVSLSVENEVNQMALPFAVELIGCRDLGRIQVYTAGQVSFLPSDTEANVENLVLEVFTVDYDEINVEQSSIYYRAIVPDHDFRTLIKNDFAQYFPRRSIGPHFVIVVTWDLRTNTTLRDYFQCVIVFDVDQDSLYVIYQYADSFIQWPTVIDQEATFPYVAAEVCGGEDFAPYVVPDSGTSAIIARIKGEIIPGVQPVGKLAFLVDDGTSTDGDLIDVIHNHIPCADGVCDLENGYCEEANVCICNSNGWTGSDCKIPNCPINPCLNGGTCSAPYTCNCSSTGYTGNDCGTLQCVADDKCKNGGTCNPDNSCSCPDGWAGDSCITPVCAQICAHGGVCTAPHTCTCTGWTGSNCSVPVCDPACENGGLCVMPNVCNCADGWSGDMCTTPIPIYSTSAHVPIQITDAPVKIETVTFTLLATPTDNKSRHAGSTGAIIGLAGLGALMLLLILSFIINITMAVEVKRYRRKCINNYRREATQENVYAMKPVANGNISEELEIDEKATGLNKNCSPTYNTFGF